MERVALCVNDFFEESGTLYIVVDRADRCRDPKAVDHRKTLLRMFVKMVEAARCRLRVLTVIDGYSWGVENYRDKSGAKMTTESLCTRKSRKLEITSDWETRSPEIGSEIFFTIGVGYIRRGDLSIGVTEVPTVAPVAWVATIRSVVGGKCACT